MHALDHHVAGLQGLHERRRRRPRPCPVLSAVKLQTYTSSVAPSRSGHVWIARWDSASTTAPVEPPFWRAIDAVELVEVVSEDGEAHVGAGVDAEVAELAGRDQQLALLAVVEIGNDVQSLHFDTPFQAKVRVEVGLVRDLGRSAEWRDALKPRAAGAVLLLAEVYPSEKYRA